MAALALANAGHMPSYGTDILCDQAIALFRKHFSEQSEIFFVFNGTAANVLILRAMTESFNAIICSQSSHIHVDECGAPELFTGCKVHALPTADGKICPQQIKELLIRFGDQHFSQPKVISITQPTEVGTVYSCDEIQAICKLAHAHQMFVHVDGARIANAAVHLEVDFKTMLVDTGVDAVSFGGTKNGLMFGEAIILLNPLLAKNFTFIRKQGLNLPSKSRFIAAQFIRYWSDGLWKDIASHSTGMAKLLAASIADIEGIEITQPVQSNGVFALIPKHWIKALRKEYFFYIWDELTFEARLMCSFDTEESDIHNFTELLREQSRKDKKNE